MILVQVCGLSSSCCGIGWCWAGFRVHKAARFGGQFNCWIRSSCHHSLERSLCLPSRIRPVPPSSIEHIQPHWCYVSESFTFLQQFIVYWTDCNFSRIVISLPEGLGSAAVLDRLLFFHFKKTYTNLRSIIE